MRPSEPSSPEGRAGEQLVPDEPAGPDLDKVVGPDLAGVVADATAVGLPYVVIGGFSVIYHGYIRATEDSDLLVPDGSRADHLIMRFLERVDAARLRDAKRLTPDDVASAQHLRVSSRHGIIDMLRGGLPPLDYETVSKRAETANWEGQSIRVADLASLVAFKRLARRSQDRIDLSELEALYGELPAERIPGLDS
jgi:hypothetical protein